MKVIIELEVENCKDCPNFQYEGTQFDEDVYGCTRLQHLVGEIGIPNDCPYIESTMQKLRQLAVSSQVCQCMMPDVNSKDTFSTCHKCHLPARR